MKKPKNQSLVIKKPRGKSNYSLPNTNILLVNEDFFFDYRSRFLYLFSGNDISAYTPNPFNKIKSTLYKKEIKDILVVEDLPFFLTDDTLISYSKINFNIYSDDFRNSKFVKIAKTSNGNRPNFLLAVQRGNDIHIFDDNLHRTKIISGSHSFIIDDCLIVGFLNTISLMRNDNTTKILIPDIISCLSANKEFIFCATTDFKIYKIDLRSNQMTVLDYHDKIVNELEISICGKYLYSNDKNKICVWNIQDDIVMGFIDDEEGFDRICAIDDVDINLNFSNCFL